MNFAGWPALRPCGREQAPGFYELHEQLHVLLQEQLQQLEQLQLELQQLEQLVLQLQVLPQLVLELQQEQLLPSS